MAEVCKHFKLHRSRYYRQLMQKPIDVEAIKLKVAVRQIHTEVHATYGSRRMRAELNAQGFAVGQIQSAQSHACLVT